MDLIGVENWDKGFAQREDLYEAVENLADQSFKILIAKTLPTLMK
jgi:hypothetical protein